MSKFVRIHLFGGGRGMNRVCSITGCQTRLSRCDGRTRKKCARCCRLERESKPKAMRSLRSRVQSHQPQIPM